MKFAFKNPLEVNAGDTIGTAILKGVTVGYVKGVLAAGVGLGALAIGIKVLSDKSEENSEPEKEEEDINEQMKKDWEEIERKIDEDYEKVESI